MSVEKQERGDTRRKRLVRTAGLGAAYAAGFLPFAAYLGVSTASVEDYFGPHPTKYEVTVDPWSTLDLGPLGTATNFTSAGPFAVEATVQGIPAIQSGDQTKLFNRAAEQYAFQYKYREDYADTIKSALVDDATKKALYYELGWIAAVGVGSRLLDRRVRELLTPAATAGLATCALAGSLTTMTDGHSSPQPGFPVSGLPNTKSTSAVVLFAADRAFPTITNFIRKQEVRSNEFVADVTSQLEPYRASMQEREENELIVFAFSDLHCSLPQTDVLKALATIYQPDATVNAGDSVTNGLRIEELCVKEAAKISDGTVVAAGNHDSETTENQQREAGMMVLDGKSISVGEFTILGDNDPERTPAFASGAETRYSTTGETEEELGERLGEQAQKDQPHVVVVHQPRAVDGFLANPDNIAAADLIISGHTHQLEEPNHYWNSDGTYTVVHQLGTAGGIGQQRFDSLSTPLTTPTTDATAVAYKYDTDLEQFTYIQTTTVTPKGELSVSQWEPIVSAEELTVRQAEYPTRGQEANTKRNR